MEWLIVVISALALININVLYLGCKLLADMEKTRIAIVFETRKMHQEVSDEELD